MKRLVEFPSGDRGRAPGRPSARSPDRGEGPTALLPGTDGVGRESPPDGGVRDRGDDTLFDGGWGEIRGVPAGQRHAVGGGQLARQCFDRHDHLRGERPGVARFVVALGARPGVARVNRLRYLETI